MRGSRKGALAMLELGVALLGDTLGGFNQCPICIKTWHNAGLGCWYLLRYCHNGIEFQMYAALAISSHCADQDWHRYESLLTFLLLFSATCASLKRLSKQVKSFVSKVLRPILPNLR